MNFTEFYNVALARKGGEQALQALLPPVVEKSRLAEVSDDRYLSEMTRCIFKAGLSGGSSRTSGRILRRRLTVLFRPTGSKCHRRCWNGWRRMSVSSATCRKSAPCRKTPG